MHRTAFLLYNLLTHLYISCEQCNRYNLWRISQTSLKYVCIMVPLEITIYRAFFALVHDNPGKLPLKLFYDFTYLPMVLNNLFAFSLHESERLIQISHAVLAGTSKLVIPWTGNLLQKQTYLSSLWVSWQNQNIISYHLCVRVYHFDSDTNPTYCSVNQQFAAV